jgi:hypothetical protein
MRPILRTYRMGIGPAETGQGGPANMITTNKSTPRTLAKAAGYYVREGSYQGTTDDRLGRWYFGHGTTWVSVRMVPATLPNARRGKLP